MTISNTFRLWLLKLNPNIEWDSIQEDCLEKQIKIELEQGATINIEELMYWAENSELIDKIYELVCSG